MFVHGNPGSSRDWEYLLARVGQFGRAVAQDVPGFGHAVEGYARYLGGVLEELGVRRAHLVLHDLGGPWGLAWAVENPGAFASVVLVNTGVMPGHYRQDPANIRRAASKLYYETNGAKTGGGQVETPRFLERPALVLWGARDPYAPVHYAERQREIFPRARVVVLEDSGHRPFADDPEAVADEVLLFLRRNFAARERTGTGGRIA